MKWYEFVKKRMKAQKITQDDLIEILGVKTRGAVGHYLTGRREPSIDQIAIIAKLIKCPLNDLMYGNELFEGVIAKEYLPTPPEINSVQSNAAWYGSLDLWDQTTPLGDDEVALPFFREVQLSAGSGISEVVENHGPRLRFSKSTLRNSNVDANHAACVTVSGNSMEPNLPDGSTVGIDTSQNEIISGELYAIDHFGQLRIKLLYLMPGGNVRIRSYNQDEWPDEIVQPDQIRVIGWVFWVSFLRKRRK